LHRSEEVFAGLDAYVGRTENVLPDSLDRAADSDGPILAAAIGGAEAGICAYFLGFCGLIGGLFGCPFFALFDDIPSEFLFLVLLVLLIAGVLSGGGGVADGEEDQEAEKCAASAEKIGPENGEAAMGEGLF